MKKKISMQKKSANKVNKFDFNVEDINDLPPELRGELKFRAKNGNINQIVGLFDHKNVLSINEILIGLYRKFDIIKTRSQVAAQLSYLVKSRVIVPTIEDHKSGFYTVASK